VKVLLSLLFFDLQYQILRLAAREDEQDAVRRLPECSALEFGMDIIADGAGCQRAVYRFG
jgi:hypothetical protein